MDPITAIAAATAAINLIQKLAPVIESAIEKGEISSEVQQSWLDAVESLKLRKGGEFSGPEWTPSTES